MSAWPSLFHGLRAVARGRLFIRPAYAPTLLVVEESPEAEAAHVQVPRRPIEPYELLALDRHLEKVLRTTRTRRPRRMLKGDAVEP